MTADDQHAPPDASIRLEIAAIEIDKDLRKLDKSQFGYSGRITISMVFDDPNHVAGGYDITRLHFPFSTANLDDAVRSAYQQAAALGRGIADASASALQGLEPNQFQQERNRQGQV